MMNRKCHAYQLHADRIHNVVKSVRQLFAHAYQIILAEHQIVDRNVQLAKNVQQIVHV